MWVRRSLLLMVLLLVVASSLLSTSEAAGKGNKRPVYPRHRSHPPSVVRKLYYLLYESLLLAKKNHEKNFFMITRVWMQAIAHTINRPFKDIVDVYYWREWVAGALKQPYFDRNPWVRCVKKAWPRCVNLIGGLNSVTAFSCPWHTYWQCEHAHELARHPIYKGGYKPYRGGTPRRVVRTT